MKYNLLYFSGSVPIPTRQFQYHATSQAQYQHGTKLISYVRSTDILCPM